MKKIPTMFERDEKTHRIVNQIKPECEWVLGGEGIATRKWDGTCCLWRGGKLFKRYDGSKGKYLPPDFMPADGAESDWLGWRPVGNGPEDRWHNEAWSSLGEGVALADGTYELVGPRVNRNPDHHETNHFERHGNVVFENVPRTFDGLRAWLLDRDIEGIVFHHPSGRMVKIKLKDFGYQRKPRKSTGAE